jgi:hypothetical protein
MVNGHGLLVYISMTMLLSINHPGNKHHISNIFNINMKLIDIDGTKEKWYDKLLTENNIKFN